MAGWRIGKRSALLLLGLFDMGVDALVVGNANPQIRYQHIIGKMTLLPEPIVFGSNLPEDFITYRSRNWCRSRLATRADRRNAPLAVFASLSRMLSMLTKTILLENLELNTCSKHSSEILDALRGQAA